MKVTRSPGSGLRPTPFLVTVVMIAATGTVWLLINPSRQRTEELAAQVRSMQREAAELEREQRLLKDRRRALKHDPVVIEREVRRQFGMVRPGEVAVVTPAPAPRPPQSPPVRRSDTNWVGTAIYGVAALLAVTMVALFIPDHRIRGDGAARCSR